MGWWDDMKHDILAGARANVASAAASVTADWEKSTTQGSWHCDKCQQFVRYGENHLCRVTVPPPDKWPEYYGPDLKRIADALERIATAMEKRNEPRPWYLPAGATQETGDD